MREKKILACLAAAVVLTALLAGCASSVPANTVFSLDDLEGKRIGVQLGTTGDIYASDVEGATVERYNKGADAVLALKQGKIDCVLIDNEPAKVYVQQNSDLKILEDPFELEEYAIALAKGNTALKDRIDSALAELIADGTLAGIVANYIGDKAGQTPYASPEGVTRSGTLTMATNAEFPPYEYFEGDQIVGLDVDMAQALCDRLGLTLQIENMNFDSVIAAVQTGKADVGIAALTDTEERRQNVDFSTSYTTATQVVIVRSK
ncbi:MAG: transporter substrate-binding domain-containing protein [Oscillospiraceae bacterium]|jgi:polar amino acid transport system substrate-binding protein|nr:transporter substrate-binding domain-containing protein [Oscillospiraceae bacterium]